MKQPENNKIFFDDKTQQSFKELTRVMSECSKVMVDETQKIDETFSKCLKNIIDETQKLSEGFTKINIVGLDVVKNAVDEFAAVLSDFSNITIIEKETLENFRTRLFSKKGALTQLSNQMGNFSNDIKPIVGQFGKGARDIVLGAIQVREEDLKREELQLKLEDEKIDVTIPGKRHSLGHRHPLSKILDEMIDIFIGQGFKVVSGPEIETDYYNFEALNMPKEHPARDTQDTFYIDENTLLRTQTTSVQTRIMEKENPPIRIISPGKVYRMDEVDATHSPVFNQIEGLVVDKGITFSDLKGTLESFILALYGKDAVVRFRPHHFPYTEPSAELDVQCFSCNGKGCRVCKGEGWIELLGCGMVHPKVLESCNIDPEIYSGFAFGAGIERIAMRQYKIDDMRLFYENDMRFLNQF